MHYHFVPLQEECSGIRFVACADQKGQVSLKMQQLFQDFMQKFIFNKTGCKYGKISESLYRNDPKFSDRYAWANSTDPDQTAPRGTV